MEPTDPGATQGESAYLPIVAGVGSMSEDRVAHLESMMRKFHQHIPLDVSLGIEILDVSANTVRMRLPYSDSLVGNATTGVLHGGAITILMDTCSGAAAFMGLHDPKPLATLDLRIDYMRPATPPLDVICEAECIRVTRTVIFVRAIAFHERPEDAVAISTGTFMVNQVPPTRTPDEVTA